MLCSPLAQPILAWAINHIENIPKSGEIFQSRQEWEGQAFHIILFWEKAYRIIQ